MTTFGSASPAARDAKIWLYGAAPDLLLGAGLGYLLSVPLLLLVTPSLGFEAWPFWAVLAVVCLASAPHYGATVLRVYERGEERRRYALFTVWMTLALVGATAAAFHVPLVGSLLVTAYVTWAAWHFSGQNYGIGLMFLRRREVDVQPAKRLLYASFVLSFVLSFLAIHVEDSSVAYTVPTNLGAGGFGILRLGIPRSIAHPLFLASAASYLVVTIAALRRLRAGASFAALAPVIFLLLTQSLWFSVPAWLDLNGLRQGQGLIFATMWINAAHSIQYLWITSYYDRVMRPSRAMPLYLLKATLAGNAVVVIPGLVFAPYLLGNVAWDRGLAILIAAVVNLHHFILDGAIWKLRDGRVARALLRGAAVSSRNAEPAPQANRAPRLWPAIAIAAMGVACLWVQGEELFWQAALREGRTEQARAAMDRLAWFGRDYSEVRLRLGGNLLRGGRYEEALVQYETSLALSPNEIGYYGMGRAQERLGDLSAAAESYRSGLAIAPGHRGLNRAVERMAQAARAASASAPLQDSARGVAPAAGR